MIALWCQTAAERSCGHRKESSDESTQVRLEFCMSDSQNISSDSGGTSYIYFLIYHWVIKQNLENCSDRILEQIIQFSGEQTKLL